MSEDTKAPSEDAELLTQPGPEMSVEMAPEASPSASEFAIVEDDSQLEPPAGHIEAAAPVVVRDPLTAPGVKRLVSELRAPLVQRRCLTCTGVTQFEEFTAPEEQAQRHGGRLVGEDFWCSKNCLPNGVG